MAEGNVTLGNLSGQWPPWHVVVLPPALFIALVILASIFFEPETPRQRVNAMLVDIEAGRYEKAWTRFETAPDHTRNNAGVQYLAAYIEFKRGDLRSARDRLTRVVLAFPPTERHNSTVVQIMILRGELCVLLDEVDQIPTVFPSDMSYPSPPQKPLEFLAYSYLFINTDEATRQAASIAPEYYAEIAQWNRHVPERVTPTPRRTLLLTQWPTQLASYRLLLYKTTKRQFPTPQPKGQLSPAAAP